MLCRRWRFGNYAELIGVALMTTDDIENMTKCVWHLTKTMWHCSRELKHFRFLDEILWEILKSSMLEIKFKIFYPQQILACFWWSKYPIYYVMIIKLTYEEFLEKILMSIISFILTWYFRLLAIYSNMRRFFNSFFSLFVLHISTFAAVGCYWCCWWYSNPQECV